MQFQRPSFNELQRSRTHVITILGSQEEMIKTTTLIVKSVRKFDKLLGVSDSANGNDVILDVCSYVNISKIYLMYFIILGFNLWIFFNAD